jgi:hypothetical protein
MMTLFDPSSAMASLFALFAYVGPGPGLSMVWALVGLLATLLAAAWAVALWPIRVLLRRWREKRGAQSIASPSKSGQSKSGVGG